MVALRIKGFLLDRDRMPIVLLGEQSGTRMLPVWAGPSEASAIIVELQKIKPPSPLTHDLMSSLFLRHGFRLERLEIYGRSEGYCYYSRLVYRRRFRRYRLETRPSDGLALAVRLGAPILAEERLLGSMHAPSLLHLLGDKCRGVPFLHVPPASAKVPLN